MLCIPFDTFELDGRNSNFEIDALRDRKEIATASVLLERSGLNLGQQNDLKDFKLIEAQGDLEEALACFQMMATQMKLPFRKDAIEKVLRDSIRRGQKPNLQLCGQLAAGMGLHVTSAKTPSEFGVRLQVPSMITFRGGFALAIRSDAGGLTLASPKEGIIELAPAKLENEFPEGIDILVMERVVTTPEQRFGPDWFMPALTRHKRVLAQVLIASFVVQLFGLANPLLIQVIIDKVISQRSLDTLRAGIGLVVTILEAYLAAYVLFVCRDHQQNRSKTWIRSHRSSLTPTSWVF